MNQENNLIRDKLLKFIFETDGSEANLLYFDFGAPESSQFPELLRNPMLKHLVHELGYHVVLDVVVAGGGSYKASLRFLEAIYNLNEGFFELVLWKNISSFRGTEHLNIELEEQLKGLEVSIRSFGDFNPATEVGKAVLDGIQKGYSYEEFNLFQRLGLNQELNLYFKDEQSK